MAVLVDTNVLADVLYGDPVWEPWASKQLQAHAGELVINPMIYAELCYRAASAEEVDSILTGFGLGYEEMPRAALFRAAVAYRAYRSRGGSRTAPLPDFFIGAHAGVLAIPLLTRDRARYMTYFPEVTLIAPT